MYRRFDKFIVIKIDLSAVSVRLEELTCARVNYFHSYLNLTLLDCEVSRIPVKAIEDGYNWQC